MTTPVMPTDDGGDYALAVDAQGQRVDPASPEAYEVEYRIGGRHIVGIGPAHPEYPRPEA